MPVIAYFDTEFDDKFRPLSLASIGVVRADGETFYRASEEFVPDPRNWWFMRNVWKTLKHEPKTPVSVIAAELQEFLAGVETLAVRTGGNHCDENLVRNLGCLHPILDIEILWHQVGRPSLPKKTKTHNALADAFYYREIHQFIALHPFEFMVGKTEPLTKKRRKWIRKGKIHDISENILWASQASPRRRHQQQSQFRPMVSRNTTGIFSSTDEFATSGATSSLCS